ncbi:MAG: ATP-dependent zinc protease [Bacteroidetes bacterium]|nr:ATP-dependent zinc protease [Bacteroidota bacterium]
MLKKKKKYDLVGSVEMAGFPELHIPPIPAKVDTGADISVLHCDDIYELLGKNRRILCFRVTDSRRHIRSEEFFFRKFDRVRIRNSSGSIEKRYKIKTVIKIGSRKIRATFTLTDRSNMTFPVLVGCNILRKRYLVDVSKKYVQTGKS